MLPAFFLPPPSMWATRPAAMADNVRPKTKASRRGGPPTRAAGTAFDRSHAPRGYTAQNAAQPDTPHRASWPWLSRRSWEPSTPPASRVRPKLTHSSMQRRCSPARRVDSGAQRTVRHDAVDRVAYLLHEYARQPKPQGEADYDLHQKVPFRLSVTAN